MLSERDDGRAREVEFVLEAAPIKDVYTLAYNWDGNAQVTWSLVRAEDAHGDGGCLSSSQPRDGSPPR